MFLRFFKNKGCMYNILGSVCTDMENFKIILKDMTLLLYNSFHSKTTIAFNSHWVGACVNPPPSHAKPFAGLHLHHSYQPLCAWSTPPTQAMSPTLAQLSDDCGRTLTSSDFNLRYLTPDQKVEGLLAFSSPEELDRFNQEARQANRHPELFALCPPVDEVRPFVTPANIMCRCR